MVGGISVSDLLVDQVQESLFQWLQKFILCSTLSYNLEQRKKRAGEAKKKDYAWKNQEI